MRSQSRNPLRCKPACLTRCPKEMTPSNHFLGSLPHLTWAGRKGILKIVSIVATRICFTRRYTQSYHHPAFLGGNAGPAAECSRVPLRDSAFWRLWRLWRGIKETQGVTEKRRDGDPREFAGRGVYYLFAPAPLRNDLQKGSDSLSFRGSDPFWRSSLKDGRSMRYNRIVLAAPQAVG
jgi:hypothetical protein